MACQFGTKEDVNHVSAILSVLSESKFKIGIITTVTAIIVCMYAWINPIYVSTGYFQMGMSIPELKRLQAVIADPTRWQNFQKHHVEGDSNIKANLISDHEKVFIPVYRYTKADLENLPENPIKEDSDQVTGFSIFYSSKDPVSAQKGVALMAEYLRDTAILAFSEHRFQTAHAMKAKTHADIKNQLIDIRYDLDQLNTKKFEMMRIAAAYPANEGANIRQVISIVEGSEKFLTPNTQLIAIETSVVEKNQLLLTLIRKQEMHEAWLRFYSKGIQLLRTKDTGVAFLNELPKLIALEVDISNNGLESVFNEMTKNSDSVKSRFFTQARFLASVSTPVRKPDLSFTVIAGLVLGLIISGVYILLLIMRRQEKPTLQPSS